MKKTSSKIIPFLLILAISIAISACTSGIMGSKILNGESTKGHDIDSIKIVSYDENNRLDSPEFTLDREKPEESDLIDEFYDIVMEAKGLLVDKEEKFCPVSDGSHLIGVKFDNDYILEFYYFDERDRLAIPNISEEDDQKILHYDFLAPGEAFLHWLEKVH